MSRRTLVRTVFRLGGITAIVLWPWLAGLRSLTIVVELLTVFSAGASVFCMFVAIALRESFAAGGLNHWDEVVAYLALARRCG